MRTNAPAYAACVAGAGQRARYTVVHRSAARDRPPAPARCQAASRSRLTAPRFNTRERGPIPRNARICARILHVAEPGDRILVLYGVGHVHWLRDCLGTLPDVALIHPAPYLEAAEQALSTPVVPADASASRLDEVGVHSGTAPRPPVSQRASAP